MAIREEKRRLSFGWQAALMFVVLLAGTATFGQNKQVNVIQGVKSVTEGVEIEIKSSEPFLQSDLPVLKIGNQEFTISRSPDDGDLNRLIFSLTPEEFGVLSTGDTVTFQYGRAEGRNPREFGRLDKSKLAKSARVPD